MNEITILPVELPEPTFFLGQQIATFKIGDQEVSIVLNMQNGDTVFRVGRKQVAVLLKDIVEQVAPQLGVENGDSQ